MEKPWRKGCIALILLFFTAFTSICMAESENPEILAMYASNPKKFSQEQCEETFTSEFFGSLLEYSEDYAVEAPSREFIIGPRKYNVMNLQPVNQDFMLTSFAGSYTGGDNNTQKKRRVRKFRSFPSYCLQQMNNSGVAFCSIGYCKMLVSIPDPDENE